MHIYSTAIYILSYYWSLHPFTVHLHKVELLYCTRFPMVLNQQGVGVLSLLFVSYSIPLPLCCISWSL